MRLAKLIFDLCIQKLIECALGHIKLKHGMWWLLADDLRYGLYNMGEQYVWHTCNLITMAYRSSKKLPNKINIYKRWTTAGQSERCARKETNDKIIVTMRKQCDCMYWDLWESIAFLGIGNQCAEFLLSYDSNYVNPITIRSSNIAIIMCKPSALNADWRDTCVANAC